jgi:hypothetical protein
MMRARFDAIDGLAEEMLLNAGNLILEEMLLNAGSLIRYRRLGRGDAPECRQPHT